MRLPFALLAVLMIVVVLQPAQCAITSRPIFSTEKKHEFSSDTTEDLFKLTVYGKNIFDGVVIFQIWNATGKEIYKVNFTIGDLMEFGRPEVDRTYRRTKEDSAFIIHVLSTFFDEKNFSKPAIKDRLEIKDNYSDYKDWNLIRQDPTATGFHYLLGAEDGRSIAYSKKKKKVIVYFTCC